MQHRRPHQRGVAALQDRKVCFEHFVQYSSVRERTAKTHERYDSDIGSHAAIAEKLDLHFDFGSGEPRWNDQAARRRYSQSVSICMQESVHLFNGKCYANEYVPHLQDHQTSDSDQ